MNGRTHTQWVITSVFIFLVSKFPERLFPFLFYHLFFYVATRRFTYSARTPTPSGMIVYFSFPRYTCDTYTQTRTRTIAWKTRRSCFFWFPIRLEGQARRYLPRALNLCSLSRAYSPIMFHRRKPESSDLPSLRTAGSQSLSYARCVIVLFVFSRFLPRSYSTIASEKRSR